MEIVDVYKYLGTAFDNLLRFSSNTEEILKKCHQRQYLLRKLKSLISWNAGELHYNIEL